MDLPYSPIHSKKWLEKYLSTNYYKKKYDRYMWWRSYTLRNPPLSNRHPLIKRIENGDFDLGSFTFEIELVEHRMNEKYELHKHDDTYFEAIQLDRARVKRLKEDRDKDEFTKLVELKKCFLGEFHMTVKQYDSQVTKYTGPDLINFYYRMEDKYGKRSVRLKPVPEFR
jgi:hypothetical protein